MDRCNENEKGSAREWDGKNVTKLSSGGYTHFEGLTSCMKSLQYLTYSGRIKFLLVISFLPISFRKTSCPMIMACMIEQMGIENASC